MILPVSPAKAFKTGRSLNKITLMVGVARRVQRRTLHEPRREHSRPVSGMVQEQFGDRASMVMTLYPVARFPNSSLFIAHRTVMADAFTVCPALLPTSSWPGAQR